MGACGSQSIANPTSSGAPVRDLSRWKTDEDPQATPSPRDQTLGGEGIDSDLTLNTVVAYHTSATDEQHSLHTNDITTDHCVTGWEDGSVSLLNWKTREIVATYRPHTRAVNRIVVGAATGSIYSCSRDTTIAIRPHLSAPASTAGSDTSDSSKPVVVLSGHTLNVSTITTDRDESTLCSGGRDTQTILWDLTTAKIKAKNTTAQNVITCSKWLPNERVVAQGSEDLSVKLWDERTALRTPVHTLRGYIYFPLCLDVSSDGLYLLTSSKGFNGVGCEARVWDRRMGKQLHQFEGHQQDATACCFLPQSATTTEADISISMGIPTAVTASKDGTVKLWDASSSTKHTGEAHEPSGRMFTSVTYAGGGVVLASTLNGKVHAFAVDAERHTVKLVD